MRSKRTLLVALSSAVLSACGFAQSPYSPTQIYGQGAIVAYNGYLYRNSSGANLGNTPGLGNTGWSPLAAGPSFTPLFAIEGIGDSYVYGTGTADPYHQSAIALLSQTRPDAGFYNLGVAGYTADAIGFTAFNGIVGNLQLPIAFLDNGGTNDNTYCSTTNSYTSTQCMSNFIAEKQANIAREAIPDQERKYANACTGAGWSGDYYPNSIPFQQNYLNVTNAWAEGTTTSGASLTCTITPRVPTKEVGIFYQVSTAGTGTFTVTIDGVQQTDPISGSTTFSSGVYNGVKVFMAANSIAMFEHLFAVPLAATHTVVITSTSANKVDFGGIDTITPSPMPNSNYVIVEGSAPASGATAYDAAELAVAKRFASYGAQVTYTSLLASAGAQPGVNTTSDLQTAVPSGGNGCDASTTAGHPGAICGQLHLAQTVAQAALAAGWRLFGNPGSPRLASGSNVVYRCLTAGATLPAGSLTITASACGTSQATGFGVN